MPATADRAFACAKSVSYGWRMSTTQKQVGMVGLVFFAVASLVVPWTLPDGESAGYSLIFVPPVRVVHHPGTPPRSTDEMLRAMAGEYTAPEIKPYDVSYYAKIDLLRLFLVMGFVIVVTTAGVLLTKNGSHVPEAAN